MTDPPDHPDLPDLPGLRRATIKDVPAIVGLLVDDLLGSDRESSDRADLAPYLTAFAAIDADPAHLLLVVDDDGDHNGDGGEVVATLQLTFVPGLSRGGALRAQIEAVRVARSHRGSGLGAALVSWAVAEAERRGCALVQLTTDKQRGDAHRFYERLGFVATHEGFKRQL